MIEHIIVQMEMKVEWIDFQPLQKCVLHLIDKVCKSTVVKPRESKEHLRSQK